ncbi:MAG: dihydroneopterin aldolase family protein [Promethearchaeota archaeon]
MYTNQFYIMEKLAEDFSFSGMTNREHAIFEVGIKLAALFHQLVGAPIKNDDEVLKKIANGLKESIACQPFVKRVDCEIKKMKEGMTQTYTKQHEFDYTYIQGKNLVAEVEVQYQDWIAIGRVEWISDLNYPLMYVKEVKQIDL